MLNKEVYTDYCKRFKMVWRYIQSVSKSPEKVISEICSLRGYEMERMYPILKKYGFCYVEEKEKFDKLRKIGSDLALFSKEGNFLLAGRYIFPVYDMLGNVVALIGWYPDDKKYVTTPSKLFSKGGMFFGMEQLGTTGIGKPYILVEGIFDCLSVRSLGLNCVAQMGIESSRYKEVLYTLFKSILAIPDNDKQGIDVIVNDKWKLPVSGKYMRWTSSIYFKDIDALCNSYAEEDVKELLLEVQRQKDRVVRVEL